MDKNLVYLAQTQTTVGFLSNDSTKLANIKQRPVSQKMLCEVDSFKTLNSKTRVPKKHRKMVRNSKLTTFIYPDGNSYRVVDRDSDHFQLLNKFSCLYSTSANITGKDFDHDFAFDSADVVVAKSEGFSQKSSSKMIKLSKSSLKRIR